jgi:ankyrin repeat protein
LAADIGAIAAMRVLLTGGADPNALPLTPAGRQGSWSTPGTTALMIAATKSDLAAVKLLAKLKDNVGRMKAGEPQLADLCGFCGSDRHGIRLDPG